MFRLKTKQDRLNMRKAWIGDKETTKYKDIEYLAEKVERRSDKKIIFTLTVWKGTEGNPSINYSYFSELQRQEEIEELKRRADEREEYKRKLREPKPELVHNLKPGDLFYTSWGYDQTNYDFIVIIEVKGKFAICKRAGTEFKGTSGTSNILKPIKSAFGDIFRLKIQGSYNGDVTLRGSYPFLFDGKIQIYENGSKGGMRLDTFFRCKDEENYSETMAQFGH